MNVKLYKASLGQCLNMRKRKEEKMSRGGETTYLSSCSDADWYMNINKDFACFGPAVPMLSC